MIYHRLKLSFLKSLLLRLLLNEGLLLSNGGLPLPVRGDEGANFIGFGRYVYVML